MFGSTNSFGQSSNSPFGSPSIFGQSNNANNNPFAPNPFGSQTGPSLFGGTSTGVFGASQSSPFSSTRTFGASSSPAFGSSMTSFGATSTPAFGSSIFGQKPAFGGFGSTTTQTNPFGSTTQQSQLAFGSSIFDVSTPFGATSQPTFGSASTPALGATSMPAFGATSTPAFGAASTPAFGTSSTPAFGSSSTPAFGSTSTPTFGSTGNAFGVSSTPVFETGGAFGASSTPLFGASSTPAFGASSTPAFGASRTPAFGASSSPSFGFGSAPTFGQSTSAFGRSPFGATSSPFGGQISPFGSQSTTPTFGSAAIGLSGFGGQRGGSRMAAYAPMPEVDGGTAGQTGKLESVSAMPMYKDKSHEELRWEDYQLGDKGGPLPTSETSAGGINSSSTLSNPFASSSSSPFGQPSTGPFSTTVPSNPFAQKTSTFGTGFATTSSAFSSSPFSASTSKTTPPLFGQSTSAFGVNSSISPAFGSSASLFSSSLAPGTTSPFGSSMSFGNTQSPTLFNSTVPSSGQTSSAFGQITSPFGQSTAPAFSQPNLFNTSSTGFANIFSSNASLTTLNNPVCFGQTTASQGSATFSFSNFGQTQPGGASSFNVPSGFNQNQNNIGLMSGIQISAIMQPARVTNPFGTLPSLPQISIGQTGAAPSVQYGISSMPVVDKSAPVRISPVLMSRHFSHRRIRELPARKYYPESDRPKVPFFSDDDETPSMPKADCSFIPRNNPRSLVIHPMQHSPARTSADNTTLKDRPTSMLVNKDKSTLVHENESPVENGHSEEQAQPVKVNGTLNNDVDEEHSPQKGDSYVTLSGHRAGEAAIVDEHGADIEALMPKLQRSDYYTEPRIQDLAAKERAEPGLCRHVKDFVIGRHGYGNIKFSNEVDVRWLDLDSLVQFNNREVIVYLDDRKKPPVGQGLNKPAEVTLLNIKCIDKKTGHQYIEGPKIERYKEMLKKNSKEQGAEFVSYDPVKGEWKFRVNHFSVYKLADEDFSDEVSSSFSDL